MDYRGSLAKRERIKTLVLSLLAALFILIAIIVGMNSKEYVTPMIIVFSYLAIFVITNTIVKYLSNHQLRVSQFLLAVLCRAENNRLYLKSGIELRPGFLGKWIEFHILESKDPNKAVTNMRNRFVRQNLN